MYNRLFLLFFLFVIGCHRTAQVPNDTLVVALSSPPATLDPRYATDANGMRINSLIFDSLVRVGPDLEAVPQAAEKWTYANHVYTFYLFRDLTFSNGRKLKPEDVEFSFAQYLAKGAPFASMLDIIQKVSVNEKDGQILVTIQVQNFSDKFLKGLLPTIKLLPKEEVLAAGVDFAKQLIGTGRFRFIHQDSTAIELEGIRAASKHLIFKVIRDDFTRYQKMLKGEVDIAQTEITPEKVGDFQKRPNDFQVFLYPGLSMSYVLVNFKDPMLKQKEVRLALAESIQRKEIIQYKMAGFANEATSILPPIVSYHNSSLQNPAFNLSAAKLSIEHLGLKERSLTLKTSNTPQAMDHGKVLAYQMSQSGLHVVQQSFEWSTFYNDVKHGNFQLATMRWTGSLDPEIYRLAFHSTETPPGRNRGSYINPKLDLLLDQGSRVEDIGSRKKIFNEVQEIVLEDLAIIPLWYDEQISIAKKTVTNYRPNSTGDFWSLTEARKIHE